MRPLSDAICFRNCRESRRGLFETSMQLREVATKGKKKTKSDASDSGEENLSKKDLALKLALDQITKSFGNGSIMWLGRDVSHRHPPVISTGSFALDVALGIGGLPKGRVVEIYGPEASGKTTLALHLIAEAQKQGGYCAFAAEHALNPSLAEAIGVDTRNLLISQPDCGEQALSLVDTLIRSGSIDVVVVDSVRSKLSTFGFGGPTEVTCGGNALKFYASVRLNIRRTATVKKKEVATGSKVAVKIVKNKHVPPFKTAEFEIGYGKGISRESELIGLGCKHKLISKRGAFLKMNEENFHGQVALKWHLPENGSAREELEKKLRDKLMHMESDHEDIVASDITDEEALAAAEA